jgi:hypothetical protein
LRYTTKDFELSQNEKTTFSISLMENIKNNTFEFGAKITYDEKFIKLGINPKYSSFNYVFGIFESCDSESLINHLNSSIRYVENQKLNGEPIMPRVGDCERLFLNDLQKYTEYKILRQDPQYDGGIYTTDNIPPSHIELIEK